MQTVLIRPLDIGRAVTAIRVEVGYTEGAAASNWRADRYDQILTGNITGVKAGEYQVLLNVTIELM
ncbi:hypothetical protein ACSFC0_25385 [Serratia marcescens]|uniref:hypothetical protein n=1 Tax=Serratia TaxID=613 RepID=UPI00221E979D|nr:hypothetical protein [Serratia marcescens]UYU06622.1 hypothetical protein OHY99_25420 [Serratia marcescens]